MKELSTIKPTVKRANFLCGAVLSSVFVISCVVVPISPIVRMVGLSFFLPLLILFSLGLVFPTRFQRGVSLIDGGFLWCSPMGGRKTIMFSDIVKIEAVCYGCGGQQGNDVPFLLSTEKSKVLLLEDEMIRTGIINQLFALPGFQRDRYSEAADFDVRGVSLFLRKKFLLYERA